MSNRSIRLWPPWLFERSPIGACMNPCSTPPHLLLTTLLAWSAAPVENGTLGGDGSGTVGAEGEEVVARGTGSAPLQRTWQGCLFMHWPIIGPSVPYSCFQCVGLPARLPSTWNLGSKSGTMDKHGVVTSARPSPLVQHQKLCPAWGSNAWMARWQPGSHYTVLLVPFPLPHCLMLYCYCQWLP